MIFGLEACCAVPADIRPLTKQLCLAMLTVTSFQVVFSISSMENGMILIQDKRRRSCYMFYNTLLWYLYVREDH